MEIIDLQLHEPAPFEDWAASDEETRRKLLTEVLWQSFDAVGVHGVVLNPMEGDEWAADLARRYPDRIAVVCGVPTDTADVEVGVAELAGRPEVRALRTGGAEGIAAGQLDPLFAACQKYELPVCLSVWGSVGCVDRVARTFPELQIIVDHLGLNQPPYVRRDDPPWKDLPLVLDLAQYENVAIKVCGPLALSDEAFPWADAWSSMARMVESYGPQRLAWASDIGRFRGCIGYGVRLHAAATPEAPAEYVIAADAHVPGPPPAGPEYAGKHNYMESIAFFLYNDQLSPSEKEQILGQTTRRLLSWPSAQD